MTLPRRKSLTPDRFSQLVTHYFLGAAHTPAEIASITGLSLSSVRDAQAELRAIGIPVDASPFATLGASVSEIAAALEPYMPETYPPHLSGWTPATALTVPPWQEDGAPPTALADDEADANAEADDDPDDDETPRLLLADATTDAVPAIADEADLASVLDQVGL